MGQKGVERDVRGHLYWMRAEAVGYAGFAALCAAGAWRFWGGHITVGEMSAYLSAYIGIQGPLSTVFQIVAAQGAAQASLERMASILDTLSTTPEPNETERHDIPLKGDITVEEVSFAYTSQPVFEDLQLVIPYGQKIALVGSSGSGKSTLSQLIMRLYDPQKGRIRLGGIDLRQCDGKQLRRSFGVVPQDPYFFQASLLDNVRLMKPGATEKEVQAALEKANAWDFVQQQAEGLKTPVGEGGTTLSGGQKQRLAIARALLIDPPYYIFDEATSALDTVSERLIQEAIGRVLLGKTALVIAHRLGTVRMCDRIVVMDKGKIVQDGTYDDLAQREGLFRRMVQEDVFKEGSET
jgi:ABC-type multidrug transport system fused ATPase/permease subunit